MADMPRNMIYRNFATNTDRNMNMHHPVKSMELTGVSKDIKLQAASNRVVSQKLNGQFVIFSFSSESKDRDR